MLKGVLTTSSGAKVFVEMAGVRCCAYADAARVCTAFVLFRSECGLRLVEQRLFGPMGGGPGCLQHGLGAASSFMRSPGLDDSPAHGR